MRKETTSAKEKQVREMSEIVPVVPAKFSDVEDVIRKLKRKEGVIVDLEPVPPKIAQRMLDFIGGAAFSLDGTVKKLDYRMYIIIPDGVKISSVRG